MTIQQQILDKIKEYSRILLFRHRRVDGDCVGATKGMKALLRAAFPEKEILIIDDEHSDYLAFLGEDDAPIADELYRDALAIVIDVATTDRIANQKFSLCREIIKIDHHINVMPYGNIMWVEEERSSACEMIAAFYAALQDQLVMTQEAATYIYLGMVTDSGRFRFSGVNGDTFRLAALLIEQGVDTEWLFANLYAIEYETLKFKAFVYGAMERSENGVASVFISLDDQARFGITLEQASAAISYLEGIRGCLSWIAFIECPDGTIRVRLRSRFVTINEVAEAYHGGGHACASGATVYSREEMAQLLRDADARVKEYKNTHEGWL